MKIIDLTYPLSQLRRAPRASVEMPESDAIDVHGAVAKGRQLLETDDAGLGVDVLWLPPYHSFPVHAHPGHHLLLTIGGLGTITLDRATYEVLPGQLYLVPGGVPHAVGAGRDGHQLLSLGAPHKKVDAEDRMMLTDWNGLGVEVPIASDGGPMCLCGAGEAADEHRSVCPRLGWTA